MRGRSATGSVVDLRVGRDYRNPTARRGGADPRNVYAYRAPMIRFTSENYEFAALLGSLPDGLNQGDTIPVVYLPEDPRGAEVKGAPRLNDGMSVLAILGGVAAGRVHDLCSVAARRRW